MISPRISQMSHVSENGQMKNKAVVMFNAVSFIILYWD